MPNLYRYPEISHTPIYVAQGINTYAIPLYASRVSAGYPMPADEYIAETIDLDKNLITHPHSTFLVIASGDSMINAGIYSGDMLVVEQHISPEQGAIVIAAVDSELTVKRLQIKQNTLYLLPENPAYRPIIISLEQHVVIWGVVTKVIAKS